MKNKVAKYLIVAAILSVMIITLMSFCACQKDDDDNQEYIPRKDIPNYEDVPGREQTAIVYYDMRDKIKNWNYHNKIEIVNSISDLEKFNILGMSYSEGFFKNYVILLIKFTYASSDTNIEFKNLAVKDGKFYPIFATDSPIGKLGEGATADIRENLYIIEADKRVLNYEFQDILVINRRDVNSGSCHHQSITTVFE